MKPAIAPKYPAPDQRQDVLTTIRRRKMASSAHAYVRGSTQKFYEWLESSQSAGMPDGPSVWICGDCHTGNLGPLSSRNGFVRMGIRDLDQTVIGNPAHDLMRLGLSLTTSARGSDLPGTITAAMLEQMIEGYGDALVDARTAARDDDSDERRPAGVDRAMRLAMNRSWSHLARERDVGLKSRIPLGATFWPLSDTERGEIETLAQTDELRRLVTSLGTRDDDASVQLVDAAYWRKGCSSLGLLRYALLLRVRSRRARRRDDQQEGDRDDDLCLLDVKEATQAIAPRSTDSPMPRDNAERVITGARALTPPLGKRMLAARIDGRAVFIRELRPQDLKLDLGAITLQEATRVARYLATVVGHAHARQLDEPTRRSWRAELGRGRTKTLDAPSWLWRSIVDLVMTHEAAYLEHCRRFG